MSDETSTLMEVGGKQYELVKTGRAQADQVIQLTRWITKHGSKAVAAFSGEQINSSSGLSFLGNLVASLDGDALIDLFVTVVGCEKEDAEIYFDVAILIESVMIVYEKQPTIKRLVDRFFSNSNLKDSMEDTSTTLE